MRATAGNLAVGPVNAGGGIALTQQGNGLLTAGTLTAGGGGLALAADGTVTLTSNVAVNGDYSVTGASVTVGGMQSATGAVALHATAGNIIGQSGLVLTSNSGNVTSGARGISLTTDAGAIMFDASSSLRASTTNLSNIAFAVVPASATITLGTVSGAGLSGLTGRAGAVTMGNVALTGPLAVATASGAVTIGTISTAGAIALSTTNGAITTGTLTSTGGAISVSSSGAQTLAAVAAAGDVTLDAGGALAVTGALSGGGAVRIGQTISPASLTIGGNTTAGGLFSATSVGTQQYGGSIGTVAMTSATIRAAAIGSTAGGVTIVTGGDVTGIGPSPYGRTSITAAAGQDVKLTVGGLAKLATVTAGRDVTIQAAAIDLTTATATSGALTLRATTTDLALGGGSAGSGGTLSAAGVATVGTIATGGNLTLTASSANVGVATVGGALAITTQTGDLTLGQGGGAITTTLDVAGKATLASTGAVYAGGTTPAAANLLQLKSLDLDLQGNLRAYGVTIADRSATAALRLGDGPSGSAGFDLSTAEINRIQATNVTFDAGQRDVAIGALPFGAAVGTSRIDILTTGRIDVTDAVTASGAGRTLRLGGSSATGSAASIIRVAATAAGGGRLLVDTADLDLRGTRIVAGQDAGFISTVANASVTTAASNFVAQPNSSLYSAAVGGGTIYTAPIIIKANAISVSYTDFALFQNTGLTGQTAGVIANSLSLTSGGPSAQNGIALFGTIAGRTGNAAALVGPDVINTHNSLNPTNSRVNGCLIASGGGGCLNSTISTPAIALFNPNQTNLFKLADDLALSFDPIIGSNNEALFSDLGTIEYVPDEPECDAGADPTCTKPGPSRK
jgi:hypothetical protein